MAARRVGNDLSRRKSDPTSSKLGNNEAVVAAELPWGSLKVVGNMSIDFHSLPAKFTVQNLLLELFSMFEKKIQYVCIEEPLDKFLNKSLKRCDDTYLDNLLRTLGNVSEVCLPSILEAFIKWYEEQISIRKRSTNENKDRSQKALLAVNYLFCIVLIELLPQLHFHPTDCEKYVNYILHLSFNEISKGNRDPAAYGINLHNCLIVAETFAEVIGVLSQTHAKLVQKTFFTLLNEYRKETPVTQSMVTNIISLLMAMKFYRIKTSQVSEIEQGVSFLDELASYYLEIDLKQKDLKHAIGALLVEILLPVAAQIKTEANIPALIAFVDKLYGPTFELINKKQHKMAAYPLLTCLLCISQSKFFLNNWVTFLNTTLSNLKNRDPKISRVALESLYRLLWVYIIRNNCEGNTQTRNRLECICNSIFPKGNRSVVPRDAPLNIFVKIIHFIAQQKLDFAFKEIIFDLLGCTRVSRSNTITIYPERMNIGIRALMVIADGLQQKEGPPGMPRAIVPVASGTIQRMRKTYLTRPLTADVARSIGLDLYYLPCRKAFDAILRTLDTDVGKCLMLTSSRTKGKEPDDLIGTDMKPKLDLFRTCIAAIPRLLPEPMPHHDLIDLLTRMTVHMDEELRQTAYSTLQSLITECADWREDIIHTYINFLTNHIQDTFPVLLESAVRFLLQLLCFWKSAIQQEKKKEIQQPTTNGLNSTTVPGRGTTAISNSAGVIIPTVTNVTSHQSVQSEGGNIIGQQQHQQQHFSPLMNNASAIALHNVEGLALALLCQTRVQGKKMAISLLREVKSLFTLMELHDKPVLTVLDEATPYVLNKYIEHVPLAERQSWNQDFASACDKICTIDTDDNLVNSDKGNEYMHWDTWACALSGYCEYKFLPEQCPTAVNFAWPTLFVRLNACNQFVDPNNPQNENRASLLRSSRSKATASTLCGEALDQGSYLSLWQKYLVMSCALTQPPSQHTSVLARSFSPNGNLDSIDSVRSMTSSFRGHRTTSQVNCVHLFQKISSMLRWEQTRDMRDNVVLGIGSTNPRCFDLLLDELSTKGILREAQERKNESNVRRRKRRDLLRLQVIRVIEIAMFRGLLSASNLVDAQSGQLSHVLLDLFSAIKVNVESDSDRDISTITSLRLHFAKTITLMVNSIPLEKRKALIPADKKQELTFLFFSWCGGAISQTDRKHARDIGTYVELKAMHALCSMLCCGPATESYSSSVHVKDSILRWIDMIFMSSSQTVQNICEDMLSTVLHLNDQNNALFEFVVDMCYKQPSEFAKRYFKSLVMLFSKREFPCELVSMLVLCQVYTGDNDDIIRQSAAWLIQILRRQFLDDTSAINLSSTLQTSMSMSDESFKGEHFSVTLRSKRAPGIRLFPTSQFFICHQLSQQYPSLTMEMISELFSRLTYLKDISRHIQASILNTLVYWMENIELIDSNCELLTLEDDGIAKERGYGNEEATRLILNNLLYITAALPSEHQNSVGRLWKTLVTKYPSNLNVVIQYLFVAMSLSPDHVIVLGKRVAKHLLNACGERFISILVNQLSMMTEQFKMTLVRHDVAPYYRWQLPHSDEEVLPTDETKDNEGEEEMVETEKDLNSSLPEQKLESLNHSHGNLPKELPMPAYGGFYADLRPLLLVSNQSVVHFTKSNLALFLLCDLIGSDEDFSVDWNNHLTTIIHSSVLCLDAVRPLVCRHARKALINIALLYASPGTNTGVVANLLQNNIIEMERLEIIEKYSGTNDDVSIFYGNGTESTLSQRTETPSFAAALHGEYRQMLLQSKSVFNSSTDLLQALVFCLSERMDKPLWANEDVGPRGWKIESSEQLSCFVYHFAQYLNGSISNFNFKWTDVAISCALSINNRHLAGRSFQIASALCQNPTPWIGRMLSRLAELVGDHNEDTQGYITHMMLCLHSLVPYVRITLEESARSLLHSPSSPTGHNRSISYTPALLSNQQQNSPMSTTSAGNSVSTTASPLKNSPINNIISPSHSAAYKKDARHSMLIENEMPSTMIQTTPLNRSKSAATLKVDTSLTNEDSIGAFVQLMSIAVAMLESHVDNEYLLALTLMDKLLEAAGPDRECCLQRLYKTIKELDWCGFSGIIGLVCKGVVYTSGYETTVSLLVKCTSLLHEPVVASPNSFSLIVTAILPYLINGFDNMTPLCITAAQTISDYCVEHLPEAAKDVPELTIQDHPLSYLSTMMIQYRNNSFTRDRFQWTKCVVNYLIDAEKPNSVQLVVFLAEMLERCPPTTHMYLLHIIYLIISHGDFSEASPVPVNAQMIRIVSKHIQGVNWKEAARIVKTVVDQWNLISVSQVSATELGTDKRKPKFELYVGSGDNANATTTNAISQTVSPPTPRKIPSTTGTGVSNHSTATGSSSGPSPGAGNVDSLRRQTTSVQSKVRERLIGLLTASGMQVGIPKSASFIFSQSTSDLYHEGLGGNATTNNNCGTLQGAASNSAYSSSERISHLDDLEAMSGSSLAAGGNEPSIGTDSFPRVFKEFDFLEAEHDSISESTESGFNWLSTIRPPRGIRNSRSGENGDDTLGDDFINPGEGEDDEEEDDIDETTDRGDLDIRSNVNRRGHRDDRTLKKRHRRPLSGASESNDISSDRTPVQSEKHSDDSCPSCPNSDEEDDEMDDDEDDDELEEMDEFKSQKSQRGASSLEDTASITCPVGEDPLSTNLDTASSIQCRSEFSIQNASDYGARKAPIYLECNHHSSGQVEQVWLSLVNSNGSDNDGEMTAHCILFFSQLFRECCVKMSGLLRDASLIMTSSLATSSSFSQSPNNQRDVSGYFTHALDVLTKASDCPFLFITAQFLRSTDLLQTQKYKLYELGGHYETFIERREQCIRALNSMSSSLKLLKIGGSTLSYNNGSNQEIELSKCIHKLFFQLLQMLDKLYDMIKTIQTSPNAEEYDLSPAVLCLHRDLLACMSEMPASDSRVSTASSLSVLPRNDQHFDTLVLHMANKQYKNAIIALRQLRSQYGTEFGCCDHMDVDVLLLQFCRSHTLRTWALVGSIQTLDHSCTQLKEISMQFAALVRTLVSDANTGGASIRSSRVSSVHESTFSAAPTTTISNNTGN